MITVFCFSYAGGVATDVYAEWGALLGPEYTVIPVDYPGRGTRHREPTATTPLELVRDAVTAIESHLRPRERWSIFGHSMGAMVAYEAARMIRQDWDQSEPEALFLSGRRPPGDNPVVRLSELDDEHLVGAAHAWGGIPPEFLTHPHLQPLIADKLRVDLALSSYPLLDLPPLECPLQILCGNADPLVDTAQLPRWADETTQAVSIHLFAGGHFYFREVVAQVVSVIHHALSAASEGVQDNVPVFS